MKAKKPRTRRKRRHYHTGTYVSRDGQSCKYRSGWELAFMKYLDENDDVFVWSYESLVIPYVSNAKTGKVRNYHPDFWIEWENGQGEIVEIKPSKRVGQVKIQKKIKAAEEYCRAHHLTFRVITEVELKGLGLL